MNATRLIVVFSSLLSAGFIISCKHPKAAEAVLASNGQALMPVVVAEDAEESVRMLAEELAVYLGRISGAEFAVQTGTGESGIALGTISDFAEIIPDNLFEPGNPFRRDEYILRSHDKGIYLIGASAHAAEHAVWDFLYRLGYRQFFPTETWEIVPRIRNLSVYMDAFEAPSFPIRTIGKEFGFWPFARTTWDEWSRRNRWRSGLAVSSGHHYQAILRARQADFAKHPEYLGLVNGERRSSKFCISNPGLRELVVDYAMDYFERNPSFESISMEPSDGGGWCECEECAELGSISDRAVILANAVAEAADEQIGGRLIGMLAYNLHAPAPDIRAHPNIVVRVTTHQRRGGETLEELLAGWSNQGATVGVSEAFCTFVWDAFMPGRQRGSNIPYLRSMIPHFYEHGARSIGGWTADSWGPVGLGNYLVSRMIWNVNEAENIETLVDDFMEKSFGTAVEPMRRFYELTYRFSEDSNAILVSEDLIGRMYRSLHEALESADDPAIRTRIRELALYARYVELYFAQNTATGDEKNRLLEALVRHTYRTYRLTRMVDSRPVYAWLLERSGMDIPENAGWRVPEDENPWKSKEPFSNAEVADIIKNGIESNQLLDFVPVSFTGDLAPSGALALEDATSANRKDRAGSIGVQRGNHSIYTWVENAPAEIRIQVTGGLIPHFRDRGNVEIRLYSCDIIGEDEFDPVATDNSVPPDGEPREIVLKTSHSGLHRLEVRTGGDRATTTFLDPGMPLTVAAGVERPEYRPGVTWRLYFYVPRGTEVVAGYAEQTNGSVLDGNGREVFSFTSMPRPGFFSIPVPEGQDGKLWKFYNCRGQRLLMTVPPYLAPSARELLLPKEVISADSE